MSTADGNTTIGLMRWTIHALFVAAITTVCMPKIEFKLEAYSKKSCRQSTSCKHNETNMHRR